MPDWAALRAAFPVFARHAYLNAGVRGPLPAAAAEAAAAALTPALADGRGPAYAQATRDGLTALRGSYAACIGAEARDVAVTTGTSDGIATIVAALRLRPGDEVLTARDEHAGVLGVLGALRRAGVAVRAVAPERIADEADPRRTRLIVCSHVGWVSGRPAPDALAQVARAVPVVLDGAQAAGAVGVDVRALGCLAYAASGQKWLCGPVGTGLLWIDPGRRETLGDIGLAYRNLQAPADGLDARPWPDARAYDAPAIAAETVAAAQAAIGVLERCGWAAVAARGAQLAATLAGELRERGRAVAPRGRSTLVSWADPDPDGFVLRAAAAGVVVRAIPGTGLVRASVGAFNDEADLGRLLDVVDARHLAGVR